MKSFAALFAFLVLALVAASPLRLSPDTPVYINYAGQLKVPYGSLQNVNDYDLTNYKDGLAPADGKPLRVGLHDLTKGVTNDGALSMRALPTETTETRPHYFPFEPIAHPPAMAELVAGVDVRDTAISAEQSKFRHKHILDDDLEEPKTVTPRFVVDADHFDDFTPPPACENPMVSC